MKVHVVTDNRSWILKRMSIEAVAHPDIIGTVGRKVDPSADINYFVNYGLIQPVNTKVVSYFTHHDPKFESEWKRAERASHGAVFMAHRYKPEHALTAFIPPTGLDYKHEDFTIGIVGTQYTNGRKGEDRILQIVKALRDLPIRWQFFGGNWHVVKDLKAIDSKHIFEMIEWQSDKQAIDFYSSIDLYFSAAYVEGGAVPSLEAAKIGVDMLTFDTGNTELWGEFATIVTSVEQAVAEIETKVRKHEQRKKLCLWDWQKYRDLHYDFFTKVLNGK